MLNHYEFLGLDQNATKEQIEAAINNKERALYADTDSNDFDEKNLDAKKAGYENLGLYTDEKGNYFMMLQFPSFEAANEFQNKMDLKGQIMTEKEFQSSGMTPVSDRNINVSDNALTGPKIYHSTKAMGLV